MSHPHHASLEEDADVVVEYGARIDGTWTEDDAHLTVDGREGHVGEGEVRRRRVDVDEFVGGVDDDEVACLRASSLQKRLQEVWHDEIRM